MKRVAPDIEQKIILLYTTPAADGSWIGAKTIGEMFDIAQPTIYNILIRYNIPIRTYIESHSNGKRCKPIKNLPPIDDSPPFCKCGCGGSASWNQRKNRWNVYIDGHYRKDAPYKHADWLKQEYIDKHRSFQDISDEMGVNSSVVRKFMRKFGIEMRTTSETLIVNGSIRASGKKTGIYNPQVCRLSPGGMRRPLSVRRRCEPKPGDLSTIKRCRARDNSLYRQSGPRLLGRLPHART